MFVLIDDVVLLWIGETRVLGKTISLALALNLFVIGLLQGTMVFRNTTGLFRKAKFIIIITAGVNIVLSIGLGYLGGIAGIVFATSIARLTTNFWYEPYILHKDIFKVKAKGYFIKTAKYIFAALVAGGTTYYLASLIDYTGFVSILYKAIICVGVPNIILLVAFCRSKEFKELWVRLKAILRKTKQVEK